MQFDKILFATFEKIIISIHSSAGDVFNIYIFQFWDSEWLIKFMTDISAHLAHLDEWSAL